MSNPYPSRRELRLQREREEREQQPLQPASLDEPAAAEPDAVAPVPRRRRRADSEITSTGMLPIIAKPVEDQPAVKPRSRREARELEARRVAARRAEVERLQAQQDALTDAKPSRRATSPQLTPPPAPVPALPLDETPDDQPVEPEAGETTATLDVELTDNHETSAVEITDMSGLNAIEIRRAELRAETERLTQEIIELGESNPNVIDPQLLRRQKQLAEKSRELQDLETAAIELGETDEQETDQPASTDTGDDPAADVAVGVTEETSDTDAATEPDVDSTPDTQSTSNAINEPATEPAETLPSRRRRRTTTPGPFVSGPFSVDETPDPTDDDASQPTPAPSQKPPLSEVFRPQPDTTPKTEPRQPVDASTAHGLDTLDAKDVEAPDRRMFVSAAIMFGIGIVALIIAIILLTR